MKTETPETPVSAIEGFENIEENFKLEKTVDFYQNVMEFVKENGKSPFLDIKMIGENDIQIDMPQDFETENRKQFENFDEILSDYLTSMILSVAENLSPEDLEEIERLAKEKEDEENAESEETQED